MFNNNGIDYGYPWWLNYGHLAILIPALLLLGVSRLYHWPRWSMILLGGITLWSAAALIAIQAFQVNGVPTLPTENFLRSGTGRVLDLGAGTGRSSIMVLRARPKTTLVASDLFADSFRQHFGHSHETPQDRLMLNLRNAGVLNRATVETADMRKLKFATETFDAAVSAYAMDHLGRDGAKQALAEAHRVLKPGGEFLLILVHNDTWTRFAFGPILSHGGLRGANWWRDHAAEAGFEVAEQGTTPASLHFLLKKRT